MGGIADLPGDGVRVDADALVVALFEAEGARLVQLARWFVDDRTAAEDLVQEAFVRLTRHQQRINDPDRAAAYLAIDRVNLARDHNRRGLMSLGTGRRPRWTTGRRRISRRPTRAGARVIDALRGLPRRAAGLRRTAAPLELSVGAIAETLGLSPNSVKPDRSGACGPSRQSWRNLDDHPPDNPTTLIERRLVEAIGPDRPRSTSPDLFSSGCSAPSATTGSGGAGSGSGTLVRRRRPLSAGDRRIADHAEKATDTC